MTGNTDQPPRRPRGRPKTGVNPHLPVRVDRDLQAAFKDAAGADPRRILHELLALFVGIGPDLWQQADDAARELGSDRDTHIRDFLLWLTHESRAKHPKRPAAKPDKAEPE